MTAVGLSAWRLRHSWHRMFATSRPWVLALYSVFLPLFWIGCRRVGPAAHDALRAYGSGELALLAACVAPCLWLTLFCQRLYAMPSRSEGWLTHDFHFLLSLPIPMGRVLFAVAAVWTLGDLPLLASTCALLAGFHRAVGASPALALLGTFFFFWMVLAVFLNLGLARLVFHRHRERRHRLLVLAMAAVLIVLVDAGIRPQPPADALDLAAAWELHPLPVRESPGLVARSVSALGPALEIARRAAPLVEWFPPYQLFRAVSMLARDEPQGWGLLLGLSLLLGALTALPLALAEPLSRRDRLALTHAGPEDERLELPSAASAAGRRRPLLGLDAKELALWQRFWLGPAALAAASAYFTWHLLQGGYTVLATAKMLGMATWMVGSMAGDSLGWERRGLVLCQSLPCSPTDILGTKARWAALIGIVTLVAPYAAVCVLVDAEPFAELMRAVLVLTFLVFIAAHAGVALGALLRDPTGATQPGLGPLLGALLWLGLCAAMVAQVFFRSGYAIFGGLFFDILLVAALWQRACVQLRFPFEREEDRSRDTVFSDAVLIFMSAYLVVTLIILRTQAAGAAEGSLNAMRTYLLTALFPLILAVLTWTYLRQLPPGRKGAPASPLGRDLAWAAAIGCCTVGTAMAYSWGMRHLGLADPRELSVGVQTMRELVAGLPLAPLWLLLLSGVIGPLAEEGFFRGLLYRGLRLVQPGDYRVAVLVSSLAFGLLHPAIHFPVVFAMGTLYAVVTERTGSLRTAILAHSLHNTAMATVFLWSVYGGK